MKNLMTSALALTALTLGSQALAGSAGPAVVEPAMVAPASQAHDWSGWYGDAYVGHWLSGGIAGNYGGVNLGYNLSNGAGGIYGGEIGLFYDPSATLTSFSISARAGMNISDNTLGFARIGLGHDVAPAATYYSLGLGLQYAFGNDMYARGEYVYSGVIPAPGNSSSLRLGIGWEF